MRITYRHADNKAYWTKRWADIPVDLPMENVNAYPLRYAERTVQSKDGKILEAGCGAGRILRYYHKRGYDIMGFDFIPEVIAKLRHIDATLQAVAADVTSLPYSDASFRYVLAFGLYHNLEHGPAVALSETWRVLEPGGYLCASFRADNIQTRLTDWLTDSRTHRSGHHAAERRIFHKLNCTRSECTAFLTSVGFIVHEVHTVENMPVLYKFSWFRSSAHKVFNETRAREEGYQLSRLGWMLQRGFMWILPNQFCNLYVYLVQKPAR